MKGMPLPFDFEGKGAFDLELIVNNCGNFSVADFNPPVSSCLLDENCFGEPKSVLDSAQISSRRTSSSTLSSSFGGGGGGGAASTDTAGVAAVSDTNPSSKWQQESATATSSIAGKPDSELLPIVTSAAGGNTEKCSMDDWDNMLSESGTASPSQEQSIIRWIIGDVEDPSMGSLNKVLDGGAAAGTGSTAADFEFSSGFGIGSVDQGFAGDQFGTNLNSSICNFSSNQLSPKLSNNNRIYPSSVVANNLGINAVHHHYHPSAFDSYAEIKPPIFNPQLVINQHQAQHNQNPSFFVPFSSYPQQQQQSLFTPPQPKRHNLGGGIEVHGHVSKGSFWDTGQQEVFIGRQQLHHQQQALPHNLRLLSHNPKPKVGVGDELGQVHTHQQQQQVVIDQLYKAAEVVQMRNPVLAQGILARLNQQLSPVGNPFQRAAFYCKEALQSVLNNNSANPSTTVSSPFNLIFKISAYKSFCEIFPLVPFANFTCNQALLEVLEGFDQIHIVDFDIGYGGQWASLMQELALKSGGAPVLKVTALVSPLIHDQLELSLTRENLVQFASEINVGFEFEAVSIDSLNSSSWSLPFHVSENEAVAVNLPVGCFTTYQFPAPLALRFVKQLSPRIVVSVDRGCDRTDLPFASHVIHTLQSHSNLLESLDAVNVNMDSLQKIERFLIQPGIEKIVMGRIGSPEKSQHWRDLFLSSGFTPVAFSNFTESQGECVVKRTPVRGFHVEKRQSSLVLCWQRRELASVSVWRCS